MTNPGVPPPVVSVVISTFNRADALERMLPSVLRQSIPSDQYEVIVVDNNSSDRTAEILRHLQCEFGNLRFEHEPRPGASHGRNRGVAVTRSPIIAFTDDDVEVAPDWLQMILSSFRRHPDAAFVGGPVLPRWDTPPPPWLTRAHWGPLALVEYSEHLLSLGRDRPLCLLTANFAVRRSALERVGLFAPEFRRCQDHELQFRMWSAGMTGVYDPSLVTWTSVPPERLRKAYHRMWYRRNGTFHALMPTTALFNAPAPAEKDILAIFGVPAFVVRQTVGDAMRAITAYLLGREGVALRHETRMWYFLAYVRARLAQYRRVATRPVYREFWQFARQFVRKKWKGRVRRRRLHSAPAMEGDAVAPLGATSTVEGPSQ